MRQDQLQIIREFQTKAQALFGNLSFKESSHEYFADGKKLGSSASSLIHQFVPKADWDAIAAAIARRDDETKESVLNAWAEKRDNACYNGSKTHKFAQDYGSPSGSKKTNIPKEQAAAKFLDWIASQSRYIIVWKELAMYHLIYRFPGTSDLILFDTELNTFVIVDYKTNEDLFKNYNQNTLLEPFDFLLDCPYNHYQIQFSYYQILLQQLQVRVSERWLIYLEENSDYKIYKCHDFTSYIYPTLAA